jgi:hypothetical protein
LNSPDTITMNARALGEYRRQLYSRVPMIGGWLRRQAAEALARDGSPAALEALAEAVTRSDDEQVQRIALEALRQWADQGRAEAQEALCHLVIEHDHPLARRIVLDVPCAPRDEYQRALFFFLTEQFAKYKVLDFEEGRPLLRAAYAGASDELKQRVMDTARRSGYAMWASVITRHRVEEVSDAEWETALQVLADSQRWDEIWRLVLKIPVKWSLEALNTLIEAERAGQWASDTLMPWEQECWQELRPFYTDADTRPILNTEGLLRTLTGHVRSIWSLDFSYDGNTLATGGQDKTIRIWKMPHGELLHTIRGHTDWVSCLAFSDRSDILASGSEDATVRLWHVPEGTPVGVLNGHRGAVRCLAFHPSQEIVASGGEDGRVFVWERPHSPLIQSDDADVGMVLSIAFSPDGTILAAGGRDGGIALWQVKPFDRLRYLGWHSGPVVSLAFSPDGRRLAGASEAGTVQIWSTDGDYVPVRTLEAPCPVWNVAFSHGGRVLVGGGGDGAVRFWRLQDGKVVRTLRRHTTSVWCLRFSPTGWLMATGGTGEDSAANLWWVLQEKPLSEATHQDLEWVSAFLREQSNAATEEERRGWRLLEALLRAKFRFDITLDEPGVIPIGEFDIEIGQ